PADLCTPPTNPPADGAAGLHTLRPGPAYGDGHPAPGDLPPSPTRRSAVRRWPYSRAPSAARPEPSPPSHDASRRRMGAGNRQSTSTVTGHTDRTHLLASSGSAPARRTHTTR